MKEVKYFDYMESSTPNKYIITYNEKKIFMRQLKQEIDSKQ